MAAKQANLLNVVRQFRDEAQVIVKKTQSQLQDLVVKTQKDIVKLAINNPGIKKIVKKVEAEEKRYEKVFADVQDRALKLYKNKAENIVSDIKDRVEGYRKQAQKLYKEATSKKPSAVKSLASSNVKAKRRSKPRKVRMENKNKLLANPWLLRQDQNLGKSGK